MSNEGYNVQVLKDRKILDESIDGKYISEICRERALALKLSEHTIYKMITWAATRGLISKKKDGVNIYVRLTKEGRGVL